MAVGAGANRRSRAHQGAPDCIYVAFSKVETTTFYSSRDEYPLGLFVFVFIFFPACQPAKQKL